MCRTRRKFTREFKVAAVKRLQAGCPVGRVARELEVNRTSCRPGSGSYRNGRTRRFPRGSAASRGDAGSRVRT